MHIAVTGAGSFIGAALHRYCRSQAVAWTGLDLAPPAPPLHAICADISHDGWAAQLPEGVDALVHLAAISRDADCRRDPVRAVEVNLTGTLRVIEVARSRGIRQVIFASSEWVYGDADAQPKTEEAVIDAALLASEYPLTKLAGERLLAIAERQGQLAAATVLRFGIVYGPRPANWSAVESLHHAVAVQDRVEVGSLDTARRFIHVDDIASGIVAAIGRRRFEVFNLTGDTLISLADVIEQSVRLHGRSPEVAERAPGTASVRNIDNTKAKRELGWRPRLDLRQGLETLAAPVAAGGGVRP